MEYEGVFADVSGSDIFNQLFGIMVPALDVVCSGGGGVTCSIYCEQ